MNQRKVCVVTGTRAEYGLLYPVMKKVRVSEGLILQVVATTMHLSEDFGLTYKQIERDGFVVDEKINNLVAEDGKVAVAKSTGLATSLLAKSFERLQPDVVLLLGDRFETHAAATAAMLMNIPIAHIHGGEITEGAVDEQIRHSITKMSYLHFTATEEYRRRVIQMGESPSRVFNSGAPGIDNIVHMDLLPRKDLEDDLMWIFGERSILFTYHPETLAISNVSDEIERILKVLKKVGANILFTYANADNGGRVINQRLEAFCQCNPEKYKVVKSLGQLRYLSVMKHADILVGNTSSGIIEAASFCKPVVNIGDRQKGRLRSGNVLDCDAQSLERSIEKAFSVKFKTRCKGIENIYGQGNAAEQIVRVIKCAELTNIKKFVDMGC